MKKFLLAGVAAVAIAGSTVVYAQHRPWSHDHMRLSPQDRLAFADARIAAVHAGLELTPDQEKLWPPVESAVRDFAKMRIDRANARMAAGQGGSNDNAQPQPSNDPVARLRERADNMSAKGAALTKIADAADPLYKSLDDAQKRRLRILIHMERRFGGGWRHRDFEHHRDRGGEWDRGGDRNHGRNWDHGYDRDGGQNGDDGGRSGRL